MRDHTTILEMKGLGLVMKETHDSCLIAINLFLSISDLYSFWTHLQSTLETRCVITFPSFCFASAKTTLSDIWIDSISFHFPCFILICLIILVQAIAQLPFSLCCICLRKLQWLSQVLSLPMSWESRVRLDCCSHDSHDIHFLRLFGARTCML